MAFFVDTFRQFMGWDLPQRDLQLEFNLVALRNTVAPSLSSLYQLDKLRKNTDQDRILLRELLLKARQLNRCKLSVRRRLALSENLIGLFYAPAMSLIAQYSKDGGVPDTEARQESLDGIVETCSVLINSYKSVAHKLHSASSFRLAHSLPQFDLSVFRIFDLLRLKQKVKGIRYQELSDTAWQTANTLIHMMLAAERADKLMILMENKYIKGDQLKTMRVRDIYAELQISNRFQLLKWPVQWQVLLNYSIGLGDFKLGVLKDATQALMKNHTISYCYDSMPTRTSRSSGQSAPSLLLNWTKLEQKISTDFTNVLRSKKNADPMQIAKHLTLLSAAERLALAQLQFDTFPWHEEPQTDLRQRLPDLRIFIGFSEVFHLLQHIAADGGWQGVGQRMADLLARHSSALSEDDVGTVESAWFMHFQGETSLRLGTQETLYTKNMKIGEITAYMVTLQEVRRPCLGVIKRIFRPQAGSVIIDIEKLSASAEAVWLNKTPEQETQALTAGKFDRETAFPGIVGNDVRHGQTLFLPNVYRVAEGSQLLLQRQAEVDLADVGNIISVTKGYTQTPLRLTKSALKTYMELAPAA
ncbi:MAG: hypothetical protein NTY70_09585 [Burkholderiales bacterium]|nr:hypothetical protein [Burkholderiales bacterium]